MIVSINAPAYSVDLFLEFVALVSHSRLRYISMWDMK